MPRVQVAENQIGLAQPTQARFQAADNNGGVAGGLAAGLADLGQSLGNFAAVKKDLQAQEQSTDFQKRYADARLAFDKARTDAREQAGPGAAGYSDAMGKTFDDTFNPLLSGISDKRVLRQAQGLLRSYRNETATSDYEFEVTARAGKMVGDASDTIDLASARVRTSADPQAYTQEGLNVDTMINGLPISDAKKDMLRRKGKADLAGADINRRIDTNPQDARDAIDGGAYNGVLDGKQLDAYRAQADTGVRRIASEQQHQIALAKSALSDEISTAKAQQEKGIVLPDSTLADLAKRAAQFGDNSNAFDLNAARVINNVNTATKGWTPQQYDARMNELRAKGTKISPQEAIELHQLESVAPSRIESFNKDPGAWASINGVPPPPLDWNNRASLDARRNWTATVSRATGRPVPFFSPNEVADLKAQAEASPKGEAAVIDRVALISGNPDRTGGMDAVREMQRIMPDDPKAARLVLLNPSARGSALAGIELLKERPDTLPDKLTRQSFEDRLGAAGALMDGSQLEGVYGVAKGIYVDMARKQGVSLGKDTDFNDSLWNTAVHRALGGRYDGQHWFGGIWTWGKDSVLIPNTVTGKQFEGAMTWMRTSRWSDKETALPVYADGKTVVPQSAIPNFIPFLRPDGRYEFHGKDGSVIHTKTGGIFLMDIGRIAQKFPQ